MLIIFKQRKLENNAKKAILGSFLLAETKMMTIFAIPIL